MSPATPSGVEDLSQRRTGGPGIAEPRGHLHRRDDQADRPSGRQGPGRRPGGAAADGRVPLARPGVVVRPRVRVAAVGPALSGAGQAAGLHPLEEIRGAHFAPSTPGDLLIHIRANRHDLCFELAGLIMDRLQDAVASADEVHGFRYFDARDLLGFVDGTENPTGNLALESVLIGDEDPDYAGGSYVLVQKYVHDLVDLEPAEHRGPGEGHRRATSSPTSSSTTTCKPAERPQRPHGHRGGRQGGEDPARQHAVRQRLGGRVRHLLHRLLAHVARCWSAC